MKITPTLIQKFFENRCTPAESEYVARYLKKHPDLMAMYLKSSWDAAGKESDVPEGFREEMREAINAQIGKHMRILRFRWLSAAASLLIVATAVWLFGPGSKPAVKTIATTVKEPAASAGWKTEMNNSAKALVMKLDDGSVVKLAPGARIRYQAPFRLQDRRDIHLEGEADFDVAYNKKRPFTVHTKLFSTTALGTSFRVSETAMGCNVKLFTGKVMIKPVSAKLKGWKKNIVLLPGHEMKYVISSGAITVDRFNAVPKKQPHRENPGKDEGIIVFDNTPLPEVMKTLNARYHSPIFYDEEQLKGKFFSGEVLGSDSLSVLLKVIANMNGLQVTKKDDGYLITPSK